MMATSFVLRGGAVGPLSGRRPFGMGTALPARCLAPIRTAQLKKAGVQCNSEKDMNQVSKVSVPLAAALAAGLVLMPAAFPDAAEV
jgi:hypothetical protein